MFVGEGGSQLPELVALAGAWVQTPLTPLIRHSATRYLTRETARTPGIPLFSLTFANSLPGERERGES